MEENITSEWKGYTKIIPEPVEVSFIEPGIEKPDYKNLTALWFGHVSNLSYLLDYMATQMHLASPKNLIILTNNMPRQAVEEEQNELQKV